MPLWRKIGPSGRLSEGAATMKKGVFKGGLGCVNVGGNDDEALA